MLNYAYHLYFTLQIAKSKPTIGSSETQMQNIFATGCMNPTLLPGTMVVIMIMIMVMIMMLKLITVNSSANDDIHNFIWW